MAAMAQFHPGYPVHLEGKLDEGLSRWLWLVKWFLVIPHYFVLAFLWVAYMVLSVIAFFAILFTGRYPRSIFEFNVGVLRWTWRVSYYAYGALATDRYPPFTLQEVADFPAHLEIEYPERLSRGLVLVKWWLLAIPHYLIVGLFVGGAWFGWHIAGGLISLLALVAAIMLAITATYPVPLFDVILGLNRWVVRVAAYAGLMTDEYPPFRLDLGANEPGEGGPGGTVTVPRPPPSSETSPPAPPRARWGAGRVVSVVIGAMLILPSFGVMAGGGVLLFAHLGLRDASGYLTSGTETFTTSTYAVESQTITLPDGPAWVPVGHALGNVRVRVTPVDASKTVFVGIASTADVERYLGGVGHAVTKDLGHHGFSDTVQGSAPRAAPSSETFWVTSSSGAGSRLLTWHAESGDWAIVAMNADGSAGVSVRASIGATAPALFPVALGLLAGGGFFLLVGTGIIVFAVATRRNARAR